MKKNRFLAQTLKNTKLYMVLLLGLSAVNSWLVVLIPMFIKYGIDGVVMKQQAVIPSYITRFFYQDNWEFQMMVIGIFLIGINLLISIITYFKSRMNTKLNIRINKNIKYTILEHVQKLTYQEYNKVEKAEIIQRVNSDANTYANFFNIQLGVIFDTAFVVFFAIKQTTTLNKWVGIYLGITGMMFLILTQWYFKKTRSVVEKNIECERNIIHMTNNAVENSKMIHIFNRERKEINNFKKINEGYKQNDIKFYKLQTVYTITAHTIKNMKEPFILLLGGISVVRQTMTLAEIAVLLSYATKITNYLHELTEKLRLINEFTVAYHKLKDLMNLEEEIDTKPIVTLSGAIQFKEVAIQVEKTTILNHLNFEIQPNEKVAILGDNGSGKTILVKTLLGFYDYTGDIYIGKYNIREINKKSVRSYIGIILQDAFLFSGTIRENINILDKELSDIEIKEACKAADIEQDIQNFEHQLDTQIESAGSNLSGGQKQRLSIARTIINNNAFIIFDDTLSKLDTKTKLNILHNLICINRGIIMISHDEAIAKAVDKVIYMEQGSIQVGTHQELLEKSKDYREMIEVKENIIGEENEE